MSAICWRLLRKNAILALATSKPFYTSHSSQKQNGSTDVRLNASQLEVLNVTFGPQSLPSNVDEDSYKEFFRQGRVYLVGTTHGDEDCVADVQRTMRRIRPDALMVEVCTYREEDLYDDDDDDVCEFRAALEESENLPDCRFVLGDRDIRTTEKRAWNVIGVGEIGRIAKDIVRLTLRGEARRVLNALSEIFTGSYDYLYDDEAERCAYHDGISQLIAQLFPEWWKAVMTERDLYMTHVLHDALEALAQEKFLAATRGDPQPVRIVAIVGKSHMDGIQANWDKRVDAEVINELRRIPPNKWIPAAVSSGTLVAIVVFLSNTLLAVCRASCLKN